MILILFTAFGAVFVAEIVGDKLLYTTGILAARGEGRDVSCDIENLNVAALCFELCD